MRVRIAIPTLVILVLSSFVETGRTADLRGELKGVLIWFYTLEIVDGKERGNVLHFKQTAGVNYPRHQIHEILPLSPRSSISRDEDENWFLDLSPDRLVVTKDRPLFLGQVLKITKGGNLPKRLTARHNVLLSEMKFDVTLKEVSDGPQGFAHQ